MKRILLYIKLLFATTIVLLQSCNEMTENKTTENKMASNKTLKPPTTPVSLPKADTNRIKQPETEKKQEEAKTEKKPKIAPQTKAVDKLQQKVTNNSHVKKSPNKAKIPSKMTGNDLVVINGLYKPCITSGTYQYTLHIKNKNTIIKIISIHCAGYETAHYSAPYNTEFIVDKNKEIVLNSSELLPIEERNTSTILKNVGVKCPPPVPYTGKMLIVYEINGKTKYQNIPALVFKLDTTITRGRGC